RAETGPECLQLTVAEILRRGDWRIAGNREYRVAIWTVVEQAAAASQHESLRAAQIVRRTKSRGGDELRPHIRRVGNAVSRLLDSVRETAGVRHDGPDRSRRVGRARRRQNLARARINRIARVAGTDGRAVVAAGQIQQRRGARLPLIRKEVR